MNALELWHLCRRRSVTLSVNGDKLRYHGPEDSVAELMPLLRERKAALLACVASLAGLPVADGPFMPYAIPLTAERVAELRAEITDAVHAIASAEVWPERHVTKVLAFLQRQPISTLADDLAYFRERLSALHAGEGAGRELTKQGA